MNDQKVVIIMKSDDYLRGPSVSDTYLFSQCKGNSGIEQDLSVGWRVKHIFEDQYVVTILLERR